MRISTFRLIVLLAYACLALGGMGSVQVAWGAAPDGPSAQQSPAPQLTLRVVGGLAGLHQYTHNEEPFWRETLARLSGGKYSAEIVPFDRAGVPGGDMLRLLELGVVPFGTTLVSSLQRAHPRYTAIDLAGLSANIADVQRVATAARPYLEHRLRIRHNIQLLALYAYPAQVLFCKNAFKGLSDLKGRRIRVSSPSQADFLGALGALPVSTPFNQIMANLNSSNIDCAVTGTMSGNTLGLHRVTSHIHSMALSWGLAYFAANTTAWNNLPPDLRALLSQELPKLESAIWMESAHETTEGMACNTGVGDCRSGTQGRMVRVQHSAADEQVRKRIFADVVLPRWLARCGADCADMWQANIALVTGFDLMTTPRPAK